LKIAFILPSLVKTGPIIFTKNLIEGLNKHCINVEIEVLYLKNIKEIDFNVKCTHISFFNSSGLDKFDIVLSTMLRPDLFTYFHRKKIKNRVISFHNFIREDLFFLYGFPFSLILYQFWKKSFYNCDSFICSSSFQKEYYSNYIKIKDIISIIPYGIPEQKLAVLEKNIELELLDFCENHKIIGSCGSLIKRKGFDIIINSLKKLKDYKLIIIGEGPEKQNLINLSKKLDVDKRVLFIDFTDKYASYYKFFDVYALSSKSEGFGLAMLEAIRQGKPILISNLEIYKDFMSVKKVVFFNPESQNSFENSIEDIFNNLEYYSKESIKLYNDFFSLKKMAESHFSLFQKLLLK
jgi:L-malate glycosyltransferase